MFKVNATLSVSSWGGPDHVTNYFLATVKENVAFGARKGADYDAKIDAIGLVISIVIPSSACLYKTPLPTYTHTHQSLSALRLL
jgi:hypothetical protein